MVLQVTHQQSRHFCMIKDCRDVQRCSSMLASNLNVDSTPVLYEDLNAVHLFGRGSGKRFENEKKGGSNGRKEVQK